MPKRIFALIALMAVLTLALTGCTFFGGDGDGGGDGGGNGGTDTVDPAAITYMADGELFLKQVVGPNTTATTSRPYKAGYTFTGWYADEACTQLFDFDAYFASQEKADVTVYAGFEEVVATVVAIVYMSGDVQFETQIVEDGVTAPTSRIPGKAGFRFTGWYADEACTQLFDFDAYFAQDEKTSVIVYAGFEVDEDAVIQIIYYVDGDVAHTQNVTAQTSASDADEPDKAGFVFAGWYADAACTELFDFDAYFASSLRNTVSVYAGFDEIADVLLHYSVDGAVEHTQTVAYDTTESDFADPVKDGYEFIGWFADAACETPFDFESYFAQTDKAAETTVYAAFEEIIEIFYYVDGTLTWTQVVSDDTAAEIPNEPGKAGYSFVGWYDKEGDGAVPFDFGAYFASEQKSDVNVYAHFERIAEDAVQISYFADGQSWRTQTVQDGVATPETIPAPTKTGYIFEGWYEDETFETPFDLEAFMAEQDKSSISVYARFDAISVRLTYMSQGTEHEAVEVTIESAEPTVDDPTKSGYEFIGWFEDEACETPFDYREYFANYFTAGASDVTVYAGFARIATITYLADGATPASQEQTVTSSTSVSAAQIPKKPGYDFVGWYREGEQEAFDFAAYFEFDAERQDVTLHARFKVRTVYIWYYADPSSDELFYTQPVTIDTEQEYNVEPTKQGYTFTAWYADPECTEEFDFDAYFDDPDKQSVSVYAGYESAAVTTVITYYADGARFGEQSVSSADDAQFNEVPTKFAYEFTGWYEDEGCKTKFEYDKFMASSDRGSAKSVYAGFKLLVTHIDEDGDGICDIDGHTDKVLVYTDNSGLELFDYRIGYISGNAANNSVNLAQAIPGGSDFTLVDGGVYAVLSGNTLTARATTPADKEVWLKYIADSRNGDKIAKTVKVHVLDGYTNVSGDWSDLYDAIMQSGDVRNVVVQSTMTSPANAAKSDGFVFIDYDYDISLGNRVYPEAGPSPYTLNLYGNALKWDVSGLLANGYDVFRIEWIGKTINITDVHMSGANVSGPNVDASAFQNYGAFFVANGSTAPTTPVYNVTHCLTENGGQHYRVGSSSVTIQSSIHRNSWDAVIKAGSNSEPGNTVVIENSVLANSDTAAIQIWGVSSDIRFEGFVDVYNWKDRDDPQVLIDEQYVKNSDIKNELKKSDYDAYFVSDGSREYTNLVVLRVDVGADITDNAGMGMQTIEYSKWMIIKTYKAYMSFIGTGDFDSDRSDNPLATVYGDADLNYELNFGRS